MSHLDYSQIKSVLTSWRGKGLVRSDSLIYVPDEFGNFTADWSFEPHECGYYHCEPVLGGSGQTVQQVLDFLEDFKPQALMVWTTQPEDGYIVCADHLRTWGGKIYLERD